MMEPMSTRLDTPEIRRPRRTAAYALAAAAMLTLPACGGSRATPTEAAPATTPSAPVTTAPPTTDASTTTSTAEPVATAPTTTPSTTAPTTTRPTTTTTLVVEAPIVQPVAQPVPPPADAHAQEPVIEVGSIVIPKLDVDMTMYEGVRLTTLDYGPGHWPGSALPGETGNVVVGGHRTSSHRVFRNVDQLVSGDEIIFRDDSGEHTYLVDRVEVVEPTAVWIVDPTETATATLFACHPPGSTAQRIVVFADLAEPDNT